MERKDKSIELRSEKIRNMIGQVPSSLIRSGTLIICIVLVILLIISIFIPYRETIPVHIKIETYPEAYFIHSSETGFFVSDSIRATINSDSVIGYIIGENPMEKITSPITGDVLMNINNEEYLDKGGLLCVIIPENHIRYGVAEISIEDYFKIKKGTKIIIILNEDEMINGIVEKIYSLSDNQHSYKIRIKFEEHTLQDKLVIGTIYNGKTIFNDVSLLKKLALSIGISM